MFILFNPKAPLDNSPPTYTEPRADQHVNISMRSCWPGLTIESYNIFSPPTRIIFIRRLCMCLILGLKTFVSVLSIVSSAFRWTRIPRIILAIFCFFSNAWLLQLLGRMTGERVVFGRVLSRWHYDVYLLVLGLWEIALVGWYFGGLTNTTADVWWSLDLLGFLTMCAAGWIAMSGPLEGRESGWSQV